MARVAGIKFEKDTKGENRYVRIDLKKYGKEINPFLENIGAVEHDEFDELWANAISIEEARRRTHEAITAHFANLKNAEK
jgi:hypothetical protein